MRISKLQASASYGHGVLSAAQCHRLFNLFCAPCSSCRRIHLDSFGLAHQTSSQSLTTVFANTSHFFSLGSYTLWLGAMPLMRIPFASSWCPRTISLCDESCRRKKGMTGRFRKGRRSTMPRTSFTRRCLFCRRTRTTNHRTGNVVTSPHEHLCATSDR